MDVEDRDAGWRAARTAVAVLALLVLPLASATPLCVEAGCVALEDRDGDGAPEWASVALAGPLETYDAHATLNGTHPGWAATLGAPEGSPTGAYVSAHGRGLYAAAAPGAEA